MGSVVFIDYSNSIALERKRTLISLHKGGLSTTAPAILPWKSLRYPTCHASTMYPKRSILHLSIFRQYAQRQRSFVVWRAQFQEVGGML